VGGSFVPAVQDVAPRRDRGNGYLSRPIAHSVIRSVQNQNDRAHLWMYVAKDVADPGSIKANQSRAAGLVEPEIETLAFKQRKHIVKERVLIRELDNGTDRNHQHVWFETLILLGEPQVL